MTQSLSLTDLPHQKHGRDGTCAGGDLSQRLVFAIVKYRCGQTGISGQVVEVVAV